MSSFWSRLKRRKTRALLDSALAELGGDWRVRSAHGLALAGLGHRDAALREAGWLERSRVYRDDAFLGTDLAEDRARILAQAGEAEEALDEIERLLGGPAFLSVHTLRLDPLWDPIREHPRFRALLARHTERVDLRTEESGARTAHPAPFLSGLGLAGRPTWTP